MLIIRNPPTSLQAACKKWVVGGSTGAPYSKCRITTIEDSIRFWHISMRTLRYESSCGRGQNVTPRPLVTDENVISKVVVRLPISSSVARASEAQKRKADAIARKGTVDRASTFSIQKGLDETSDGQSCENTIKAMEERGLVSAGKGRDPHRVAAERISFKQVSVSDVRE
jgi:hypothetical protein